MGEWTSVFIIGVTYFTSDSYSIFPQLTFCTHSRIRNYLLEYFNIFISMIKLFDENKFQNSNSTDLLPLECYECHSTFFKQKKRIKSDLKLKPNSSKFCSRTCKAHFLNGKKENVTCLNCQIEFLKYPNEIRKSKNNFCSSSCSTTYNNKHKSHGNRRSKLEIYIEEQLTIIYPNLHIEYNKTSSIGSELDIYIPSLNIAFELNGIFHYEPIFGINKLTKIQNNDQNKFRLCIENKIDLCIIDTSNQKYVKPSTSKKYLDIIINIINQRTSLTT